MARPGIDLPLKLTLTTAGVEWFEKNHKAPKRLQMADKRLEYGIAVGAVPASSLQRMINIDYIASVELARSEFSSKSGQIIDLTKLIVHRVLLKKFESDTFRLLIGSALVNRWNQLNPSMAIGKGAMPGWLQVDGVLAGAVAEMQAVSTDIQVPLVRKYLSDKALSEHERSLRTRLSSAFMLRASKPLWWLLAKSRGQVEYETLAKALRGMLEAYVEKALISKHLALIVVELLGLTEVSHFEQVASRLRGRGNGPFVDEPTQEDVRRHMEDGGDLLSLTYHLERGGESVDMARRLRVTILEQGDRAVKDRIETLVGGATSPAGAPESTLRWPTRTERGRVNLASLRKECEKQNVGVDISVSQIPRGDFSLINLAFQL